MVGDFSRPVDFIRVGMMSDYVPQELQEVLAFLSIGRRCPRRFCKRLEFRFSEKQSCGETLVDLLASGFLGYFKGSTLLLGVSRKIQSSFRFRFFQGFHELFLSFLKVRWTGLPPESG